MPREFLQYVFGEELEDHAYGEVSLLELIAFIHDFCQVEVHLADVRETDVARVDEGCELGVRGTPDLESDFMVELASRDLV